MNQIFSSARLSSLLLSSLVSGTAVGSMAVPAVAHAQQPAAVAAQVIDPDWLSFDSTSHRVYFALTAGLTPYNGALNFNGFRDGELTIVVPVGWTMMVNFVNHDGMLPHSAEVIRDDGSTPMGPVDPAIQRAYTKDLETGVAAGGGRDAIRFTTTPAGNYRFYCAVPGHGAAGMWIRLKVDPSVTAPRMVLSPKSAGR